MKSRRGVPGLRPTRSRTGAVGLQVWLLPGLMAAPALAAEQPPARFGYELVRSHPHDPDAFTQGLVYDNGKLYESTGLYGASTLRVVDLQTGAVEKMVRLPPRFFAEGLTLFGDRLIQLTWKTRLGLVFDKFQTHPDLRWVAIRWQGRNQEIRSLRGFCTHQEPRNFLIFHDGRLDSIAKNNQNPHFSRYSPGIRGISLFLSYSHAYPPPTHPFPLVHDVYRQRACSSCREQTCRLAIRTACCRVHPPHLEQCPGQ
jgi:hypothetical protein